MKNIVIVSKALVGWSRNEPFYREREKDLIY